MSGKWDSMIAGIQRLMDRPGNEIFSQPVDWKGLGLTDYLEVVKHPMDLGTIVQRLREDSHYEDDEHVYADIRLVFDNAVKYNKKGQDVYRVAWNEKRRVERMLLGKRLRVSADEGTSRKSSEKKRPRTEETTKAASTPSEPSMPTTVPERAPSSVPMRGSIQHIEPVEHARSTLHIDLRPTPPDLARRTQIASKLLTQQASLHALLDLLRRDYPHALVPVAQGHVELNLDLLEGTDLSRLEHWLHKEAKKWKH